MNKVPKEARRYAFTWNNYTKDDVKGLRDLTAKEIDYCIWGYEKGENGTPHLQGYVEFSRPVSLLQCKKRLDKMMGERSKIHLGRAEKNRDANINYVRKDSSKDEEACLEFNKGVKWEQVLFVMKGGSKMEELYLNTVTDIIDEGSSVMDTARNYPSMILKHGSNIKMLVDLTNKDTMEQDFIRTSRAKFHTYFPWQREIVELCRQEPDGRTVQWIYDSEGGAGKTTMGTILQVEFGMENVLCASNGRSTDIAHTYVGQRIVLFDFARTNEEVLNYDIVEQLANGKVFSGKYVSTCKAFQPPHLFCFANWLPDPTKLSFDRWRFLGFSDNDRIGIEGLAERVRAVHRPHKRYNNNVDFSIRKTLA